MKLSKYQQSILSSMLVGYVLMESKLTGEFYLVGKRTVPVRKKSAQILIQAHAVQLDTENDYNATYKRPS